MNIKKQASRVLSVLLSFAMAFGSVLPVNATDIIITRTPLEETETIDDGEDLTILNNDIEVQADSGSEYETVEVNYNQPSSYYVTIPKTITLGTDKKSPYSIKVEGDVVANKQVCVVPVDGITDTEVFDFYMKDQIAGSTKDDVVAEVSQAKFYWNHEEVAAGYEENGNYVIADGLSAGTWKGTFQLEISLRTDPTHIHNYVGEVTKEPTCTEPGEKTYLCDCGDSYTETIEPTGHHYEKGECTICGEKDPNHKHNYTETITKEPTCTEEGEKTYTCDCGDRYKEKIPSTAHKYVEGECEYCGKKDPDYHKHNYTETINKEPTCTEPGEKTYTCDCGDSYTEEIPATGHHYGDDDRCEDCGEWNPNHKHSYTEEVAKEPTCMEEGEKTYTCICGDSYTEIIETTEHDYIDHDLIWEASKVSRTTQSGDVWTFDKGNYSNASATFNVTVNETIEYTFNYYTKVNSSSDYLQIKLDNTQILKKSSSVTNGAYTITLTPGTHTLYVYWYSLGTAVNKATLTLKPIEHLNHKCTICGNEDEHDYKETISKAATCIEKGEKKFTCVDCGYSYTEEYESLGGHIDEDNDDICDVCGHKHIWEENTDIISWVKNPVKSSSSSSVVQTGNTWKLNYVNASSQYTTYTLNGYWDITVPEDIEYTFDYDSGFMLADDSVKIYVDDNLVVDFANASKTGSKKISLSKGEHTIHVCLNKNNRDFTGTYASITLNSITDYNHVCKECGEKNRHSYTEKILKAPTCTEKGEKELTCIKCGHSHTEEIEPTGHSYVDHTIGLVTNHICSICGYEEEHKYGTDLICTVCGHFRGEYTFVFKSESKIGSIASDVKYEYEKTHITDGGTIYLPDASSSDYDLNGWYYAKNTEQPYMYNEGLSHVTYGTLDKSYDCWFNSDLYLRSCGNGLHVTNQDNGKEWYTNYQWQNMATTDVFTVEIPSVYEFQITEEQHIDTIALNGGYSLQYLLKDITNAKSYDMHNLASSATKFYDYGNIKIKCHKVDNADKNDTTKYIDGKITYYYTVYFEPGEYQITLSGRLGSSTASPTISTIEVNMYGQNSHFYELHSLEEGESFDSAEIYTMEGDKTIYCIPKWTAKQD